MIMKWWRTNERKYTEVNSGTGGGIIDSDVSAFPKKLNESVYEFYRPENGLSPDVEVVFFHGVYRGDSKKAYLETWTCSDGSTSHCWPKTWVAKRFPSARILSISYDSSIQKGPTQGRVDLYCVAENLLQDLTDISGNVGARDACPLILVGHGYGGLVIKAVCLQASDRRMEAFLSNVKGILYYATPQLGLSNVPAEFDGALAKTLGWNNDEITRLNYRFQKVRKVNEWAAKAILAAYPGKERQLDVKEASARFDVDEFYTAQEDIDTICRPREETSITVTYLTGLLSNCIASKSRPGSATKRGVQLTSSLLFDNDEYYVPMGRSRDEILNALNSPGVRIVVLHGVPGSGKTSLAKHLALWFVDESNMHCQDQGTTGTSSDSRQRSCFIDGVIYLTCGKGADVISKQQELLQNFNVTLRVDDEIQVDGVGLRRKLVEHLQNLRALIILDDIWEIELLDKLVVPGRQIKYLVTTQVTTWTDYNIKNVPIQNVCQYHARKIMGNYAGFRDGVIPERLMEVVDELIKATQCHPLALATLAMVVRHGDNTSEQEWGEVRENFLNCLKSEKRARGYGETYPRTVYAAMLFAMELLDDNAKTLLYTIVCFQGSFIPEYVVQLFLESTEPERSWETTYSARKRLESLGLVHRIFVNHFVHNFSAHKYRAFAIHGLRQQFILSSMVDYPHISMKKFLHQHEGLESERDLATALCSMFGGSIIQEAAIRKLGARFIWSDSTLLVRLTPCLSLLLSVIVEKTQGAPDNQLDIANAATEVFWMLFNKGEVDDDNLSFLLRGKTTICACVLLYNITVIFTNTRHALRVVAIPSSTNRLIDLFDYREEAVHLDALRTVTHLALSEDNRIAIVKNYPSCLKRLVALLSHDVDPDEDSQKEALRVLTNLSNTTESAILMKILETPGLLECVVMHLSKDTEGVVMLLSKDTQGRCTIATRVICNLAKGPSKLFIVRFPSCLERLVALLAPHMNENAQMGALLALVHLTRTSESLVLEILGTSGLLERVVRLLSEDTEGRCRLALKFIRHLPTAALNLTIVRFPLFLERLAALLAPDVDKVTQTVALRTIMVLAGSEDNRVAIVNNYPSCLKRLVALLSHDVDPDDCQKEALRALTNLASTSESAILMKILGTPGLLERVVMLLSKDTEGVVMLLSKETERRWEIIAEGMFMPLSKDTECRCTIAARFICNLAKGPSKLFIVRFPSCLERLVDLLAPHVNEKAQMGALLALVNLTHTSESLVLIETLGTSGLLERVVRLLSKDTEVRCKLALNLISHLATEALNLTIVRFPLLLERLAALLAPDVEKGTQKDALRTITVLAGSDDNRVAIVNNSPSCLERLVALLFHDVDPDEDCQKEALRALTNLADTSESAILMKILGTPGLLERVVMLLSKDTEGVVMLLSKDMERRCTIAEGVFMCLSKDTERRCTIAGRFICNLAKGPSKLFIVRFPSCLERLVALLAPHVDKSISKWAVFALARLGMYDENEVDEKMLVTGDVLGSSVMLTTDNSQAAAMLASPEYSVRDEIVELLTKAHVHGGACSELYRSWSYADLQVKDYPGALIYNTKALEVNADNGSLWLERGFLQWHMGDFLGALADYSKALEVHVDDGFSWQERGVLRRFMGDFPGALEDLNKALQLDPDDYEVLKHRGLVKFMMEDEEGARADAERAILVKPSRVDDNSYGKGCLGVLSVEFLGYALK